jgi:hypothetical protein
MTIRNETMKLLTLHKILIGMALAFFLFFGIREIMRESGNPVVGAIVLGAAVGICFYFVWVLRGGYQKKSGQA